MTSDRGKKEFLLHALGHGEALVALDPRIEGVLVPESLRTEQEILLHLGMAMRIPIRDLVVNDDGLSCTLSYDGAPFFSRVPWSAVHAIVDLQDDSECRWSSDIIEAVRRDRPMTRDERSRLRAWQPRVITGTNTDGPSTPDDTREPSAGARAQLRLLKN